MRLSRGLTAVLLTAEAVLLGGSGQSAAAAVRQAVPVRTADARLADPAEPPGALAAPGPTLRPGARGTAVRRLQERLTRLGYRPGPADGRYGGTTQTAVWAFQKVNGITPSGTVGTRTWTALERPRTPRVLVPGGAATRIEIDLTRQLMILYTGGRRKLISHISSGSGIPYCESAVWQGRTQRFCGSARTPTGDYRTTWRVGGWHRSYLGRLYNPIFFNGGIALHGALSVPLTPVSHGCVRLPMNVAGVLPGLVGKGVPVHVRGRFAR